MTKFEIEEKIVAMLKTVFDPEIPVNVYDLGLIYKIDVSDSGEVNIDMTTVRQPTSSWKTCARKWNQLTVYLPPPSIWCSNRNGTRT